MLATSRMIIDSDATVHVVENKRLYVQHHMWSESYNKQLLLDDGKTKARIHGAGTIDIIIKHHCLIIDTVLYIPGM